MTASTKQNDNVRQFLDKATAADVVTVTVIGLSMLGGKIINNKDRLIKDGGEELGREIEQFLDNTVHVLEVIKIIYEDAYDKAAEEIHNALSSAPVLQSGDSNSPDAAQGMPTVIVFPDSDDIN